MEYGLAVGIDGSKAESGSRTIVRSLQDISQTAESATNSIGKTESATGMLSNALSACKDAVGVAAGAFAAWKLADLARDAGLLAARVQTLGVVMTAVGNNAGYAGSQMNEFAKSIAAQGITTEASRQSAIRLAQAHVDMSKSSNLARIAQDAAVIANTNSSDAFDRMTTGISTGQAIILHHMGLMVNFEGSYKSLADTLGKTSNELTETEKTTARVNEVMKAGAGISGSYDAAMGTAGKSINSMARFTEELKLAWGALALPSLTVLVNNLTDALNDLNKATADNKSGIASTGDSLGSFTTGTLTHFKKEISEVNALIYDMKSGLYLLGAVAAAPGMVAGTDLVKRMLAQSNQAADSARAIRDYAAAVKAADNGQPARDPSDIHMMAVRQMQLEDKRIAAGNAARALEDLKKKEVEYTDVTEEHWKTYTNTLEHMNKQIRDGNPYLDELTKKITAVDDETNKAIRSTPEYTKSLTAAGEALKHNITLAHDLAEAIKATSVEMQYQMDLTQSAEPQGNNAGNMNLRWDSELKALDALQPSAGIDALNEQIKQFEHLLSDIPAKSAEVALAIAKLKADFSKSSGLDALVQGNINMNTALIEDPYTRIKQQLDDRYAYEKNLQEQALADAQGNAEKVAAVQLRLSLLKQTYDKDAADNAKTVMQKQLAGVGEYAGMAGQLFTALASTRDQSDRKGFESAKAFNMAAAVMSTAAAVMNAMATVPWPGSLPAAALAASTGAIQIAKIASTSFGGGATAPAAVGSAAAAAQAGNQQATSGADIGSPTTSIHDSLSEMALQALASAADNASVAIGKVADGLTSIADMLATSQTQLALKSAPNQSAELTSAGQSAGLTGAEWGSIIPGLGTLVGGIIGSIVDLFGGSWNTTSAGFSVGLSDSQVASQNYADQKKDGGWFSSDSHRTEYSNTDPAFTAVLQASLTQIVQTINRGAIAMGTTANTSAATLDATKIQTSGMTTQQIQDQLNTWFETAAAAMSDTVAGLKDFTAYGESTFDALVRLSTALQGVNGELQKVGATLITATLTGADAAYHLSEMFGGVDKFTTAVDNYFKDVFTKSQQDTMQISADNNQLKVAFGEMHASYSDFSAAIPTTRDGFAALVNSLDLSTVKGQGLFQALMTIAPAFGDLMTLTENASQALLDFNSNLQERSNAAQGLTYTEQLYKLQVDQEKQLTDARKNGMDVTALLITQQQEYSKAVSDIFKQATTDAISIQTGLLQGLTGIIKSTLSPQSLYQQDQVIYENTKSLAEQGNKQALTDLTSKANDLLSASSAYNGSNAQYQTDYNDVVATLSSLAGLSTTSPTLETAQSQLSTLQAISTAMNEGNKAQLQYLQGLLTNTGIVAQYLAGYLKNLPGDGTQTASQAITSLNLPSFDVGSAGLAADTYAKVHRDEIIMDANTSRSLQKYGIQVHTAPYQAPLNTDGLKATNAVLERMARDMEATARNTGANVKVDQAGFSRLIEIGEQQAADIAELKRKARQG